jgi:hypothetical protein
MRVSNSFIHSIVHTIHSHIPTIDTHVSRPQSRPTLFGIALHATDAASYATPLDAVELSKETYHLRGFILQRTQKERVQGRQEQGGIRECRKDWEESISSSSRCHRRRHFVSYE